MPSSSVPGNNPKGGQPEEPSVPKPQQSNESSSNNPADKPAAPSPMLALNNKLIQSGDGNKPSGKKLAKKNPSGSPQPGNLSAPPSAPPSQSSGKSCSKVATSVQDTGAILHEFATYSLSLPGTGGRWEIDDDEHPVWDTRNKHQQFFEKFRQATQRCKWSTTFDVVVAKAVSQDMSGLYNQLKNEVNNDAKAVWKLDDRVCTFMNQETRLAAVIGVVQTARDIKAKFPERFMSAQLEQAFRKVFDDFFHIFLDDDENRYTIMERTLNFPRNEYADLLRADEQPDIDSHLQQLEGLNAAHAEYLKQIADWSNLPQLRLPTEPKINEPYKVDKFKLNNVGLSDEDHLAVNLFRYMSTVAVDNEKELVAAWRALPKTFAERVDHFPRTGKCDAITFFRAEAKTHIPNNITKSKYNELRIDLLQRCALVQLTQTEISNYTPSTDDRGQQIYCKVLGRKTDLRTTKDILGTAAVVPELMRRCLPASPAASTMVDRERLSNLIDQFTMHKDLDLENTVPILVPLLVQEYKRELSGYLSGGGNQARMYLNATCQFLDHLEIRRFMVFGLLAEGTTVGIIAAWKDAPASQETSIKKLRPTWIIDSNTVVYDLTRFDDAYQFACFVAWVHTIHRKNLSDIFAESKGAKIKRFVDRVLKGDPWTASHQNPPKTRTTN